MTTWCECGTRFGVDGDRMCGCLYPAGAVVELGSLSQRKPAATTPIVTCGICRVSWTSHKADAQWVCPSCKGKS
jgi:uncharacterized CHY-type Zn-finger protein